MTLTPARQHIAALAVVLAVLGAASVLSYRSLSALERASAARQEANEWLALLGGAVMSLQDAQRTQRGFLLTGDDEFLTAYAPAIADARKRLRLARDRLEPGSERADTVERLARIVDNLTVEMDAVVARRRAEGLEAAIAMVREGRGKRLLDDARALAESVETLNLERLRGIDEQVRRFARTAQVGVPLGGAIAVLVALAACARAPRAPCCARSRSSAPSSRARRTP